MKTSAFSVTACDICVPMYATFCCTLFVVSPTIELYFTFILKGPQGNVEAHLVDRFTLWYHSLVYQYHANLTFRACVGTTPWPFLLPENSDFHSIWTQLYTVNTLQCVNSRKTYQPGDIDSTALDLRPTPKDGWSWKVAAAHSTVESCSKRTNHP